MVVRLIYILSKILKGIFWCNKKSLEWKNFICVCDENVKFSFFSFGNSWNILQIDGFFVHLFIRSKIHQFKQSFIFRKLSQKTMVDFRQFKVASKSVWKKREVLYYQYTLVNYSVKLTFTKFLPKMHDNRDNFIFMELTFLSRVFLYNWFDEIILNQLTVEIAEIYSHTSLAKISWKRHFYWQHYLIFDLTKFFFGEIIYPHCVQCYKFKNNFRRKTPFHFLKYL